jgi:NAD(P)H-dependent flavin oxidoreductase YrpB (nitropropane dioxygenase family)
MTGPVTSPLTGLGVSLPLVAAPMAGGPTTPALVIAAGRAGALGFLAGGYLAPDVLAGRIAAVREAGLPFGVNLFAPNPVPADPAGFRRYASAIQGEASRYGVDLSGASPVEDDDHWRGKIDVLLASPVPVVTFTFGIPGRDVIEALRGVGTITGQTVTSAAEARQAADAGLDLLAVQSAAAGGHSGTLTPSRPAAAVPLPELVAGVRAVTGLPLLAAGGIATPAAVAAVLQAGASAAVAGTALLLADEAGTSAVYRAALAAAQERRPAGPPPGPATVVTRAFTGRPARGLANLFTARYSAVAPSGYPALHHLTRPIRAAAAAAGDPDRVNLWAGTGYQHAAAQPAAQILTALASGL